MAPRRAHASGRARPRCGRTPVPACSPPPRPSSRACCPWKTHVRQEHGVRGTRAARRLQLTQAADVTPPAHRDPGRRANGTPGAPRPPPRTGRPSGAGLGLGLVSRCPGLSSRLCLHGTCPKSQNRSWAGGRAAGSPRGTLRRPAREALAPRWRPHSPDRPPGAGPLRPPPAEGASPGSEQGVPARARRPLPSSFPLTL